MCIQRILYLFAMLVDQEMSATMCMSWAWINIAEKLQFIEMELITR
jgi:hypothetical protein